MPHTVTEVLNHKQIQDRITRIAWQIYESYFNGGELIIAGVAERGYLLAKKIEAELNAISDLKISLHKITVDKKNPLAKLPSLEPEAKALKGKSIIVVDDVLNTGSTLIYAVKYFLEHPIKNINTVVLVDRNHKNYPVKADFKGLSLSTSMKERVEVIIEKETYSVVVS